MATRLKTPIDPDHELAAILENAALEEYPGGKRALVNFDRNREHFIQALV